MATGKPIMTDAEIDALAKQILREAAEIVRKTAPQACRILTSPKTGELFLEFFGTSKLGYGSFRCRYFPLEAIKNLIKTSERLFDEFAITLTNKNTGEVSSLPLTEYALEHRKKMIGFVADAAGLTLVASFFPRFAELLEDEFKDHELIAKGAFGECLEWLEDDDFHHEPLASLRPDIDRAVARVADRKRGILRNKLGAMPNIVAERGRGALPKTPSQRDKERREYTAKLREVYRELYLRCGAKPKKTLVAKTLGEGGVNPRTGSDSSLQAFNLKLRRLEISYEDVTRSIHEELNSNS
jgi:hypothetical protein